MCNPRKVVMRATEQLAKAWQAELSRTVRLSGSATGEARLVQPLGAMLAPPALNAFERAVGSDPSWLQRGEDYYLAIPGGTAIYRPQTQELELMVQLSEELMGEGVGRIEMSGTAVGEGSGEAEGRYDSDGWRGRTREKAEQAADAIAREQARRQAELDAQARAEQERRAAVSALNARRGEADNAAYQAAQADLEQRARLRSAELNTAAQAGLEELRVRTMEGVFRTVAAGIQQALVEFAVDNGAAGLVVDESEDLIEIQFEMEA